MNNNNKVPSPENGEGNNEGKSSILPVVNGGEVETDRVMKLENELFDYQYNMGLLLIEKQHRATELEEIRQALAVTNEKLKREQMTHLTALSEMEKRDQELRKTLGVEKQCVADLEKALHKMREESAQVKYASDRKMEEAHALVLNIEDKSSELKMKLTAVDVKFAEVSRISLEMERKLKQVEARESAIRSEYHSFIAEREMHEVALRKQRMELQAWERLLQEREERQLESWSILNQGENRGNENVETLRQKLKNLEESQRNTFNLEIDVSRNKLKRKELLATADKLNVGETMEGDLQMEKRKKSLVKKLQSKVVSKDKRLKDSMYDEVKIGNQEYELEKKVKKSPDLAEEQVKLHNQTENLNLSEEEKNIIYCLQAELEQERDKCIVEQKLLSKEREDLKRERENFEKEWEMLDMNRAEIAKELKSVSEEKQLLIKLKHIKQETLTNENMVTHDTREFEALGLERGPCLENERTPLAEKTQIDYENILHLPRLNNKEAGHTGLGLDSVPRSENTSWLRKCTSKIFTFSSLKRNENNVCHGPTKVSNASIREVNKEAATGSHATLNNKTEPSLSSNIFDMQGIQSLDDGVGAFVHEPSHYVDTYNNKTQEGTNDVKQSKPKTGTAKPGPKVRKPQKMNGVNEEIQGSFLDKGANTGRKRNYANASKTTTSEQDVDNRENESDDFGQGHRNKRLQTVVLALEAPVNKRHNFRRPRNLAKATMTRTPNFNKGKMKTNNGMSIIVDRFVGFTSDNRTTTPFVNSDIMEDHSPAEKSARVEVAEESDCENSRSMSTADAYVYEDEIGSEFSGEIVHENEEDWEEDDDDEEHLGMIIGRKLWTFFTT